MNKEFLQSLREQIKSGTVTEQEPMSRHTSFSIGGPADVFVQPATKEEIKNAIFCAKEAGVPFFVMGNGSNLLVSDEDFRGMIIQIGKNFQEISVQILQHSFSQKYNCDGKIILILQPSK